MACSNVWFGRRTVKSTQWTSDVAFLKVVRRCGWSRKWTNFNRILSERHTHFKWLDDVERPGGSPGETDWRLLIHCSLSLVIAVDGTITILCHLKVMRCKTAQQLLVPFPLKRIRGFAKIRKRYCGRFAIPIIEQNVEFIMNKSESKC